MSVGKYFCRLRNVFVEREVYLSDNKLEKYFGLPRNIFVGGIFLPVDGREYVNAINSWQIYFSSDKMIFGHFWALWLSILVLNEWFRRFQMGIKYEIKNKHSIACVSLPRSRITSSPGLPKTKQQARNRTKKMLQVYAGSVKDLISQNINDSNFCKADRTAKKT